MEDRFKCKMNKLRMKVSHISYGRNSKEISDDSKTGCALAALCATLLPTREALRAFGQDSVHVIQNFQLVWLNTDSEETHNQKLDNVISTFRYVINSTHEFDDIDTCVGFIKEINEEKIFMIVSGAFAESAISRLHHLPAIYSIYLLHDNDFDDELWSCQWSKVKGAFMDVSDLCKTLEIATQDYDRNTVSMSFIDKKSSISHQRPDSSFIYTQALKDIVFEKPVEQQDLKEWTNYYRKQIVGNMVEQKNIEQFEAHYHPDDALQWYTSQSLFPSVLNHSLRTMDIDTIIKMGFFIRDLHQQITQLHTTQNLQRQNMSPFVVYRGQGISGNDFQQLMKSHGGLVAFNDFLSASTHRAESLERARQTVDNSDSIGILFEMTIDPSIAATAFINIDDIISNHTEEDILFSLQPIFRIGQMKSIDNGENRLWKMRLTLIADHDPHFYPIIQTIREENFGDRKGWSRFSELFLKENQLKKVQQVCDNVLYQTSDEEEKGLLYYQLAFIKYRQEQYNEANTFYHSSLQIREKVLPPQHVDLAACYNGIALVYEKTEEYAKALISCHKALDIYKKILPPNHILLAVCRRNIGKFYEQLGEYPQAILSYKRSLKIYRNILPLSYPDMISTYKNIALIYEKTNDNDKASSFLEKAITLQEKTLPAHHRDLGDDYYHLAVIYEKLQKYSNALCYYEKSLKIYQEYPPANPSDLAALQNNIGVLYHERHDDKTAVSYFQKAHETYRKILPANHPDLAASHTCQGTIYKEIGKYSKALLHYKKAFEIHQNIQPVNYLALASSYSDIGSVYYLLDEYSTALSCYEKALKKFQKHSPSDPCDLAYLYTCLGEIYEKLGEPSKALSYYQFAFNIEHTVSPEDHPSLEQLKEKIQALEGTLNDIDVLVL